MHTPSPPWPRWRSRRGFDVNVALVALVASLATAGCLFGAPPDSGEQDDPFSHRAYTAWSPLPSKDGSVLALALEPRRVDADSSGVVIRGWRGQTSGEGVVMVAAGAARRTLATVPRGFLTTDLDPDNVFVWTKAAFEWTPVAPNDAPPTTPFASVTWLDRETFAVKGTRTFDPPLERPIALGGGLLVDSPTPGDSDFERAVRIAVHELATGKVEVLHEGRGFTVATCARDGALTVAYQREKTKTTVVDVVVTAGRARAARLDLDDFLPDAVVCRPGGQHAALFGGRPSDREGRALVLSRTEDALTVAFANSVALPGALSLDGSTLLATGPNAEAMLVTKSGALPLSGVTSSGPVVVSGDRAIVQGQDAATLVSLDRARPNPVRVSTASYGSREAVATGASGFLLLETKSSRSSYGRTLTRALAVDASGAISDVTMPEYESPKVAWADGARAYMVGSRAEVVELVTIDLAGKKVSGAVPFPLCDPAVIRAEGRCSP